MKKLLILGAGVYQVPLIKTAKRLGCYTIVSSIDGNYPGFDIADKVYRINTVDTDAMMRIAEDEDVDGVVTAGSDVAVVSVGKVCDKLGFKGLSEKAAEIASDKLLMKQVYEKYGVNTAKYRKIYLNDQDYENKLDGLEFPLIFKAIDSSGSRGITRVDSPDDFDDARESVIQNTKSDHFIVEEFIDGYEFGAQAFVQDGKIEFILPHGDYVFKGDTGVPVGHYAPFDVSDEQIENIKIELTKAINAMGLDNCAINADFIMKDDKVYVLEIGGRSGATCLAELTSIYYGFDYYEKIVQVALGEHADFAPTCTPVPNASKLLISDRSGKISSQTNNNDPSDPDIIDVAFDYNVGDEIRAFHVGPDRIGQVITKGETLEQAVEKLDQAMQKIEIKVL